MSIVVSIFIYLICATIIIYFLFAFYTLYLVSYDLSEEGVEVNLFSINLNFIRYDEIISVRLSSMQITEVEVYSYSHQRPVPVLPSIRIVVDKIADPLFSGFGSPKKVMFYIYPRNISGFYDELLSRVDKTNKKA